ncbi:hypothetical protein ACQKO6_17795 [Pseudomonas monteilii]
MTKKEIYAGIKGQLQNIELAQTVKEVDQHALIAHGLVSHGLCIGRIGMSNSDADKASAKIDSASAKRREELSAEGGAQPEPHAN